MTKFNVGDKVIFNKENAHVAKQFDYKINKPYEVQEVFPFHHTVQIINEKGSSHSFDEERFELVETKPTKNQRITALENEVAELKLIVHELRDGRKTMRDVMNEVLSEPSTPTVEDIIEYEGQQYKKVDREAHEGDVIVFDKSVKFHGTEIVTKGKLYKAKKGTLGELAFVDNEGDSANVYDGGITKFTPENVAVYELIKPKPLTPNQQRAAIIEKAKKFVKENKNKIHPGNDERTTIRFVGIITDKLEFVINEEKRTVVALIKGISSGDLYAKGIAKCNPSDVFNEHIGKAIALGRALGLDVSEFEQAVQPIEIVKGMEIMLFNSDGKDHKSGVVETYNSTADEATFSAEKTYGPYAEKTGFSRCIREHGYKILNDTNAKYEVSSNE